MGGGANAATVPITHFWLILNCWESAKYEKLPNTRSPFWALDNIETWKIIESDERSPRSRSLLGVSGGLSKARDVGRINARSDGKCEVRSEGATMRDAGREKRSGINVRTEAKSEASGAARSDARSGPRNEAKHVARNDERSEGRSNTKLS